MNGKSFPENQMILAVGVILQGEKIVLVDAINHALSEELAHNEKTVLYGQDIAGNKGGVFTATRGLTDQFGKDIID